MLDAENTQLRFPILPSCKRSLRAHKFSLHKYARHYLIQLTWAAAKLDYVG